MAACGSLRSLFENPLPENPTLIESLSSWNNHKPMTPFEVSSLAEMFGEIYFQEKLDSPVPIPSPLAPPPPIMSDSKIVQALEKPPLSSLFGLPKDRYGCDPKGNGGFSSKKSESLQLCTEGLGSESSDDVDDMLESGDDWRTCGKGMMETRRQLMYGRYNGCLDVNSMKNKREFPPPISSIGKRLCLKSYREDGRFVLREERIPTQELLLASREDGRLKLHFVHADEDIIEGEEENNGEDEEEAKGVEIKAEYENKASEGEDH